MPSGPSKPPPCGTESKCEPVSTASCPHWSPHQANRLPLPSSVTAMSRRAAWPPAGGPGAEVRAGEPGVVPPLVAPPGEQFAVAVVGDRHVAARGLVAEPVAQHQLRLLQRVAQIAAVADPPDRCDPVPEL